jgi:hypothetical protein
MDLPAVKPQLNVHIHFIHQWLETVYPYGVRVPGTCM